jgi:hypothetical protein
MESFKGYIVDKSVDAFGNATLDVFSRNNRAPKIRLNTGVKKCRLPVGSEVEVLSEPGELFRLLAVGCANCIESGGCKVPPTI